MSTAGFQEIDVWPEGPINMPCLFAVSLCAKRLGNPFMQITMSNKTHVSRRMFLKIGAVLWAMIKPFVSRQITQVKAEKPTIQSFAYGNGGYGQGAYPGLNTHLPAVIQSKSLS